MRTTMLRGAAAATLFAVATALPAAEYALDVDHSTVQFSVPLLALSKVTGKFMRYDVKLSAGKKRHVLVRPS